MSKRLSLTLGLTLAAGLSLIAAQAFAAPCDEMQEAEAGSTAASVAKAAVTKVVPVTGKQMVSITSCEFRAGTYIVDYKYNFLSTDGLYWVEANSKFGAGGAGATLKVNKKSPNLQAAEEKSGIKLASN